MVRNGKTSGFGIDNVSEDEKPELVKSVFTSVSSRYDLMNDAMSFGAHRLWKTALINWLEPRSERSLLDVAGGTGDIAIRYLEKAPAASVTVLDFTESMIDEGRNRAVKADLHGQIDWVVGDAMAMPFADWSFDACTMSFGLRNFARIPDALAEAFRVLKLGGRLIILEFSRVPVPALRRLYDLYSFHLRAS